jgi:hypothetical protein
MRRPGLVAHKVQKLVIQRVAEIVATKPKHDLVPAMLASKLKVHDFMSVWTSLSSRSRKEQQSCKNRAVPQPITCRHMTHCGPRQARSIEREHKLWLSQPQLGHVTIRNRFDPVRLCPGGCGRASTEVKPALWRKSDGLRKANAG